MEYRDMDERNAGRQTRPMGNDTEAMQGTAWQAGPGSPPEAPRNQQTADAQHGQPGAGGPGRMISDTMHTVGAVGGSAVDTTHDVLRGAISATGDVASGLGGETSHVAKDLVQGVRGIGGDVGLAVRDGATGLIHVVGDVGGTAVHTVRDLLVDIVSGVRDVAGAAVGRMPGNGTQQARSGPGAEGPLLRNSERERQTASPQDSAPGNAGGQHTAGDARAQDDNDADQDYAGQHQSQQSQQRQQSPDGPFPFPSSRHH